MAIFEIQRDVMSGQCKGALARIQVRYTALFIGTGWIRGWAGSQIGLFTPRKTESGYRCTGFYFQPWLAPDIAVCRLPRWYRAVTRAISFRFE